MKPWKTLPVATLSLAAFFALDNCNLSSSDVQALLPPTGVTAAYDSVSGVVTVGWNTLQDTAVAGYTVYRRQHLSDIPTAISSALLAAPPFKDTTPPQSSVPETLYYSVKTQDQNGDVSLYSDPATVRIAPSTTGGGHFPLQASTVALWTFDAHKGATFADVSANAFNLYGAAYFTLTASPFDSASVFTGSAALDKSYLSYPIVKALTVAGTGKITYEARVYLATGQSGAGAGGGWLMGTYDGMALELGASGLIDVGGQRVRNGTGYWINEQSSSGIIPKNRWVDLAAAFDQTTGQVYAYIDGKPVQLYSANNTDSLADPFRISTGAFFVGNDGEDQAFQFSGKIDEIRVSNNLALGPGLPLIWGTPP